ncbi:MAG: amidohydrolase 2 [Candidatus Parvarchaeum acidiphilum ARMAN-4]|jgi:predicted TIM-barrel fold metal-dependent hydrolase|uniref:Amidohydrolase 2 n=1 Tax=Candidatus Parvarchaeum acidiphilum ARMAN-4 TaxID=662760 RepID=D2EGI3_PARA4|nr:MAG: amidohydrolase 2 [Candidatus Parvarchaeum acidiphilum ARMAN-4]
MIIDFHTHSGVSFDNLTFNKIQEKMRQNGINKAIIFPSTQESYQKLMQMDMETMENAGNFFIPFLRFNPKTIKKKEFEELQEKFYGFKLHPRGENFDPLDKGLKTIFKAIEKSRKPVIIHSRKENNMNTDPERILELAGLYPKINFVFAHFANDSDAFFSKINEFENAYVDTSVVSSPFIIERRVKEITSKKIIFGSDYPFSDQEIELLKIKKAGISEPEKEDILHGNAERLLGLRKF